MNIRSFIAIPIPDEINILIHSRITEYKNVLSQSFIRWVPESNIHLTLKFLGDVPNENLNNISREVGNLVGEYAQFDIHLNQMGIFPNIHKPQVIWIGGNAPEPLFKIADKIESIASKYGIPRENRPFAPHFTIGRVSRNINGVDKSFFQTAFGKIKMGDGIKMKASEIAIIKSDLRPSGAIYTTLFTFPLL